MFVSEEDKLRHEILKEFYDVSNMIIVSGHPPHSFAIPLSRIVLQTKVSEKRVIEVCHLMRAENDIQFHISNGETSLQATATTITAFITKKYLNARKNRIKDRIDFTLKFIGLFALIFTVSTFIYTCNKSKDNKEEINLLQKQIKELQDKAKPLSQPKKSPSSSL